jgi:hypothetical protein
MAKLLFCKQLISMHIVGVFYFLFFLFMLCYTKMTHLKIQPAASFFYKVDFEMHNNFY